jgi:hypothetical protein
MIAVNETRGKKAVQRVEPYHPDGEPGNQAPQQESFYPSERFEANFQSWAELISSGQKTPEQIISNVQRGGKLTSGQLSRIRSVKLAYLDSQQEEPPATDEPPAMDETPVDPFE